MAFTNYISIDVATKSLAVGLYRTRSFVNMLNSDKLPNQIVELDLHLDSIVQPLSMNVYDINHGAKVKDTSVASKAASLKQTLNRFDADIAHHLIDDIKTVVLIEYQMNANHLSNAIFNMIVYHYADRYDIQVMKPSWKNTIALHPKLTLSEFLGRASSNYKANKEHTKWNMIFLLTVLDKMDLIQHIKNANRDDIADTLCQALAFHMKQS
jgi:hypothetical protein